MNNLFKDIYFDNFTSLSIEDAKEVLEWRNHELVRKQMFTSDTITFENHLRFIESLKQSNRKLYLRVRWKNDSIGVIDYYDVEDETAFWGLYLNPKFIGSAWGVYLEFIAIEYAFCALNLKELQCETLESNEAVLKIHSFFNFSTINVQNKIVIMKIDKKTWNDNKHKISPLIKILKQNE